MVKVEGSRDAIIYPANYVTNIIDFLYAGGIDTQKLH